MNTTKTDNQQPTSSFSVKLTFMTALASPQPRTMQRPALLLMSLFLALLGFGCSAPDSTGLPQPSTGSLRIEAQIVYDVGGSQPVAREWFFLYDTDPAQLPIPDISPQTDKIVIATKILPVTVSTGEGYDLWQNVGKVVEPHIVKRAKTDFNGRIAADNLTPGDYWIVGRAKTRVGEAIWMQKVTVGPGENKVLLDQKNALVVY